MIQITTFLYLNSNATPKLFNIFRSLLKSLLLDGISKNEKVVKN
jgi:hypothetical protein